MAWREAAWSLGSRTTAPALIEVLAFVLIGVGFALGLRRAERGRRLAIGFATACLIVYAFVRAPEIYFAIDPAFAQSRRAELLSTVALGLPLGGLGALLSLFLFSFGLYEVLSLPERPGVLLARYRIVLRGILCAAFLGLGLLAVFGYGSGSPWLF